MEKCRRAMVMTWTPVTVLRVVKNYQILDLLKAKPRGFANRSDEECWRTISEYLKFSQIYTNGAL